MRKEGIFMKKTILMPLLILTLVLVLALVGCKKKDVVDDPGGIPNEKPVDKPDEMVEESEREIIMKDFVNIIESKNQPDKIIAFIDDNIGKLSQLEGDKMIDSLEKVLKDNIDTFTDRILALDKNDQLMAIGGGENFFPESKIEDIEGKELREEVQGLYKDMYKLVNLEGEFYPIIDYDKLRSYNNYITDEWKEYIGIMAMDSEMIPFVDGAFAISFDELADRIIKTENYLNKYLDGQRQEEMLLLYENKLIAYLEGLPNTPLADSSTKKIFDDVLASYEKTSNIENYVTSNIVYRYLEDIKANDKILDENIKSKSTSLLIEALELLREYK